MKYIWKWSETVFKKAIEYIIFKYPFCWPFVEYNHKPKKKIYYYENKSIVQWYESWVLSIISWIKLRCWKSNKKFACVWKSISQLTQKQLRYLSLVRPDLNLSFGRQLPIIILCPRAQILKIVKSNQNYIQRVIFFPSSILAPQGEIKKQPWPSQMKTKWIFVIVFLPNSTLYTQN